MSRGAMPHRCVATSDAAWSDGVQLQSGLLYKGTQNVSFERKSTCACPQRFADGGSAAQGTPLQGNPAAHSL